VFSPCTQLTRCQDTGCTHNLEDQSDYNGMVHQSEQGDFCLDWSEFPDYAEVAIANQWGNACRNLPNGDMARAWCFTGKVGDATPAYCDIGRRCPIMDRDEGAEDESENDDDLLSATLSSTTSRSEARRAALTYASHAEKARARLMQEMEAMGHSMPDKI
jgi:hypothetical protein